MTKPIPDGYHAITPYLIVAGGAKALEFYRRAFGAIERERMQDPSGKIRHAEISIGDPRVMLADEHPEIGALGPATIGGSPVSIHLYVEDVDAVVGQGGRRGRQAHPPRGRPVLWRSSGGGITDPFGHHWHIATHKEDLTSAEIHRRAAAQGH